MRLDVELSGLTATSNLYVIILALKVVLALQIEKNKPEGDTAHAPPLSLSPRISN